MLYIFSPLLLLFMARTVGFDVPHPATHSTLKSHSRARISHTAIRRLFLLTSDRLFFFFFLVPRLLTAAFTSYGP